jgi:hypothetical protein
MGDEYEKRYVEPIVNASRPGTLAGLSLTVLRISTEDPMILKIILTFGAIMFLLSSFFIFFYSVYPTRRILWTGTAITFLMGLFCTILSSVAMLILI